MDVETEVMNTAHFVKMAHGDPPWLRDLAVHYFEETRRVIPAWMALLEARNFDGLREELHRCKGGASMFGFERIRAMMLAGEGAKVLETRGFDVAAFKHELTAAEKALSRMMKAGP